MFKHAENSVQLLHILIHFSIIIRVAILPIPPDHPLRFWSCFSPFLFIFMIIWLREFAENGSTGDGAWWGGGELPIEAMALALRWLIFCNFGTVIGYSSYCFFYLVAGLL